MAVMKCKMCGGELTVEEGASVAVCEYCGSKQTVPKADDEKKMKLFDRANRLRFNCEFDKAGEVYENIVEEFPEEAEAYWGNLLCKYGIEYVDDPATGDKVPTCHRSSFDSFMDDPDFEMVMENSDTLSRSVYREQAKQIEDIRKGITEVSGKEAPYDIFICYKETAEDGQRTLDSVIAQDVYDALTAKGYRVFFSRISLEDKLGTEYEPYIFAALNSAKVMLAFGTSYDYYNAVWVKNEWSRFLKLMTKDKTKALIPCYKDIDAYDMPKEFSKLQAQDMGKIGAVQDLLRGVDKLMGRDNSSMNHGLAGSDNQEKIPQGVLNLQMLKALDSGNFVECIKMLQSGADANSKWKQGNERYSILNRAIEKGSNDIVRLLLEKGADPNSERVFANGARGSALSNSILQWPNDYAAELLMNKGANVNAVDVNGNVSWPILTGAVYRQNVKIVRKLLEKGANPNCERTFSNGHASPLCDSVNQWPNDEIAEILINAGADVNNVEKNDNGDCPILISALIKKKAKLVRLLLEKGANPNCERILPDGSHKSALQNSIINYPDNEIAKMLIDAGADVNHTDVFENVKIPILVNAICNQNEDIVRALLEKGANPNIGREFSNGQKFSPLDDSIRLWPNDHIAEMLINAGADTKYTVREVNNGEFPVLTGAITKNNEKLVRLLLEKGADPNSEIKHFNGDCESLLTWSILNAKDDRIAKLLVDAGADVCHVSVIGTVRAPALVDAVQKQNVQMVHLLLEKGADPNSERIFQDGQHFSVLRDSIYMWPNDEIAKTLIAFGADVNHVDKEKGAEWPVLTSAIRQKNVEMVHLMLEKGADPNRKRILENGQRYSALHDSICEWPNEDVVREIASRLSALPVDVPQKISSERFKNSETVNQLKRLGCKFPLFGGY